MLVVYKLRICLFFFGLIIKERSSQISKKLSRKGGCYFFFRPAESPNGATTAQFVGVCCLVSLTTGQPSSWEPTRRVAPPASGPTPWTCLCPATPWSAGSSATCCTKCCVGDTEMHVSASTFLHCSFLSVWHMSWRFLCLMCRLFQILTATVPPSRTWVICG